MPKHEVDVPSLLMALCFTANVIVCLYDRNSIPIQKEVGILTFATGSALFVYAILYLGAGFFGETEPKLDNLVTKGPYRLCRHPVYLSFIVMTLGIDLALRSTVGLVLTFALSIPSAVYRAIVEERLLGAKFGDLWSNYAREVGFMFPKFPVSVKTKFTEMQAIEAAALKAGDANTSDAFRIGSEITGPIQRHPSNPHYFLFRGKPLILITSAEHYGAVVNKDFDFIAYLDSLEAHGLNYTRIYPGFLFEPENKFMKGNTLGPKPEAIILPWARSQTPGYALGGNRFDLDRWDLGFFKRLRNFMTEAAHRDVVVEICFFNAQYQDTWPISPLYFKNNIQGIGDCDFKDAQTLRHPDLLRIEEEYVIKIIQEVNRFDNVILEICDEPIITGTPASLAGPWVSHFVDVIKNAEKALPKRHLIAQQVEGPLGGPCDLSDHPDVSIIVSQYVWEASGEQMGGMKALDFEYDHDKPIELNETYYYPEWYKGDRVAASRVEAWEFIVGGGAGFNHLNGQYTVENPTGSTPDNALVCQALNNLKGFMCSFDYIEMGPDLSFIVSGIPKGCFCRGISQPGVQYALYLHHSIRGKEGPDSEQDVYVVLPGSYSNKLVLNLPAGTYQVDWVEPASGSVIGACRIAHKGGHIPITTPVYSIDIALRIKRTSH